MRTSRPLYETASDRQRELRVAEWIARQRGLQAVQLPPRYAVDFGLMEGVAVRGWIEVKCRTNPLAKYPTYMLSMAKYHGMLQLQYQSSLPVQLAVRWTDGLGILDLHAQHSLSIGGRKDRMTGKILSLSCCFPLTNSTYGSRNEPWNLSPGKAGG